MIHAPIQLPDEATAWARSRVEAGKTPSVEAYFTELARRDRAEAEEVAHIQALLDEGEASGVDPRPPEQIFAEVRAEFFGRNG